MKLLLTDYSHIISNHSYSFLLICLLKEVNNPDRNLAYHTNNQTFNLMNQTSVQSQTTSLIQQSHNIIASKNVINISSTSVNLPGILRFIYIIIKTSF